MSAPGLSVERISELRRLCEAATAGPWGDLWATNEMDVAVDTEQGTVAIVRADHLFIAASRTALPELLDALQQVQAERDDALGRVAQMRKLLESWEIALGEGINTEASIPGGWSLADVIIDTHRLLELPPLPRERTIAAALELADEVDAWARPDVPVTVLTSVVQDALEAYRQAAKEPQGG